ncbi:hypothetical protein [Pseudomonas alabamensis]|uniref:hypothetical protein n=1 Tax=Pseudomonas alabamensis TaxID=3064349 RepID=UPI0021D81784|nr:hypothetical protein [Pseudomonas entomophila]
MLLDKDYLRPQVDIMLLAKSCKSKYNIKNGSIKLGTLYEYRSIENDELVDKQEGMLTFNLNFRGKVEVPPKWFATISGGAIGFSGAEPIRFLGRQSAYFKHVHFESIGADKVILKDSSAVFSHESLNSFIFCVSRVRRTTDCIGIFKGCDDYWYLPEIRADRFARRLGQVLLNHIIEERKKGNHIIPAQVPSDKLKIMAEHRQVDYLSREIDLYKNSAIELEEFTKKMRSTAFTKPKSYKNELEYRFNFTIVSENCVVEPLVKSVFLDSSQLLEFLL